MYISKLSLINYRNFANTKLVFSKGINTIIGENGSGKTNLFRAIRLLLDNSMRRSSLKLGENDFNRGLGAWHGHWIIVSLEFDDVSEDESIQSLFLHSAGEAGTGPISKATYNLIFRPKAIVRNLLSQLEAGDTGGLQGILSTITIDDYETIVTGKSSANFNNPDIYRSLVGDFQSVIFPEQLNPPEIGARVPPILSMAEEISFTYVQALRDVIADFRNNRTNPLLNLLKQKSGEVDEAEFAPIVLQVKTLNETIGELSDVVAIQSDIKQTINDTVGDAYSPSSLSIKSDLPDEAEHLFQSLKLFISESDDSYEGAIHEMSLGGANLIYLTLKLLEFKYQKSGQAIANFLLIEEPEAHIHTHIQKSLFNKLSYPNTQIIYSTHSSHIAEVSNIKNVNVLGKVNGQCEAFQPASGLTEPETGFVQRYLDAIRSNLLFAKSVILVEGDAEEILIPTLIKKVFGISLDELGISLVNIRSTGFKNIALLFHNDRIRKQCSIITDLDDTFFDTVDVPGDSDQVKSAKKKARGSRDSGSTRKTALDTFCNDNDWLNPFYAPHTFEVDFINAGNSRSFINILDKVYTDSGTIATSKTELESPDIAVFGKRALTMANHSGKGWFAIILGDVIDYETSIPDYIIDAVFFAHGTINNNVIFKIINYRITMINQNVNKCQSDINSIDIIAEPGKAQYVNECTAYIASMQPSIKPLQDELTRFKNELCDLNQIRTSILTLFPYDKINPILARL